MEYSSTIIAVTVACISLTAGPAFCSGGDDDASAQFGGNATSSARDSVKFVLLEQPDLGTSPAAGGVDTANVMEANVIARKEAEDERREFAGLNFGVGISSTFDLGKNDRVSDAEIVDGLVRVTDEDNVRARVMLESHYFFVPEEGSLLGLTKNATSGQYKTTWGIGPFVALQPGTDEIIEAIGLGIMLGFKRAGETSNSFNLGFGVIFDPNTKTLGQDIVDGQPLPGNETEIRFLEQDQFGLLVLSSFSF